MKKLFFLLAVALPCFIFTACGDEEDDDIPGVGGTVQNSYIVTGSVSDVAGNFAVASGTLNVSLEALNGASFGIVYSTQNNPSCENNDLYVAASSLKGNSFSVTLLYLRPKTKYYYCAYYKSSNSVYVYGSVKSFTTGDKNAVDLGLSVKWATCNVGANSPEEYGDYFAWGETEPKKVYDWSTYKWCKGTHNTQTKYCTSSSCGTVDNKTTLDPEDDAATANWGGAWRMPTRAEQDELRTKCTWTWTTQNGVYGRKVTGPSGNSIFLPAAGYRDGSDLGLAGSYGGCWSSSLYSDHPDNAYYLRFSSDDVDRYCYYRSYGRSVRPVCQ